MGLLVCYEATRGGMNWFSAAVGQTIDLPAVVDWEATTQSTMARSLFQTLAAAEVLGALYVAGGCRLIGFDRRVPVRDHAAALGYYLRFACPAVLLGTVTYDLVTQHIPQARLEHFVGRGPQPIWAQLQQALTAGWHEEIIATALVMILLENIHTRTGRVMVHTAVGTLTVILFHLAFHLQDGPRVLTLIVPTYFTVLCWRHARSLPALIIGHVLCDLAVLGMPRQGLWLLVVVFSGIGIALDRRHLTAVCPDKAGLGR